MKKLLFTLIFSLIFTNAYSESTNLICKEKTNYGEFIVKVKIDSINKTLEYQTSKTTLNFKVAVNSKTEIHAIWVREDSHILIVVIDKIEKTMKLVRTDSGVDVSKFKCGLDM